MGLLRQLGRRAAARIARRVAQDNLFEKPGERAPTPPLASPATPVAPTAGATAPAASAPAPTPAPAPAPGGPAPTCVPMGLDALREALTPRGRPLVVHHWATWCEPCEAEMPQIEALRLALVGHADLVGVSWDLFDGGGEPAYVAGLVRTWATQVGSGLNTLLADAPPEDFFLAFGLDFQKIPQTRVYGPDGALARAFNGALGEADVQVLLAQLGVTA